MAELGLGAPDERAALERCLALMDDVEGIFASLPDIEEQSAIATVLADIAALEARRDKTRAIKQGMMQQLLTGRVRLVRPSHAVTPQC
ncbi:hypothetical protein ABC977_02030 [Thioalkalicoccus limnaeus]|uniref:Restriction endonuclease subunit S n=1 Tax=Thioalkalicoccus limnaeus TaxID=120681 RepID=A0ABV4B9W1_9GAMM